MQEPPGPDDMAPEEFNAVTGPFIEPIPEPIPESIPEPIPEPLPEAERPGNNRNEIIAAKLAGGPVQRERVLIGTLLHEPKLLQQSCAALKPKHFSQDDHQQIFRHMLELNERGLEPSIPNVWDALGEYNSPISLTALGDLEELSTGDSEEERRQYVAFCAASIRQEHAKRAATAIFRQGIRKLEAGSGDPTKFYGQAAEDLATLAAGQLELAEMSQDAWTSQIADPQLPPSLLGAGLLVPGEITLLVGAAGVGKTYLACELAMCLALGHEFHGIQVTQQQRVAFLELELTRAELNKRFVEMAVALGLDDDACKTALQGVELLTRDLLGRRRINLFDDWRNVARWLKTKGCNTLLVDSFQRSYEGNELDDMPAAVRAYERILDDTGAACLILHHEPKITGSTNRRVDDMTASRGHTCLTDAAKCVLRLVEDKGKIALRCGKTNLGPLPEPVWLQRAEAGQLVNDDAPLDAKGRAAANRAAILEAVQKAPGAVEVEALAIELEFTDRTVRQHLAALAKAGLVESVILPSAGRRGPPKKAFQAAQGAN